MDIINELVKYFKQYEYKLLSEKYKNAHQPLLLECPQGHKISMNLNNFKSGKRCKICNYKNKIREKIKEIEILTNSLGFKFVSLDNKPGRDKITLICPRGHEVVMRLDHFKGRRKCPLCSDTTLKIDDVRNFIEKEGYQLLTNNYKNCFDKLLIKCDKGHEYSVNFHNFKNGNRCPYCQCSKGEIKVKRYLESNNIVFIPQKTFDGCKYKNKLSFDFYLPEYNICIEYDGIQHYQPNEHFGGEKSFIEQRKRDIIKNDYCEENNIHLIRISYKEFKNIETILSKTIKKY